MLIEAGPGLRVVNEAPPTTRAELAAYLRELADLVDTGAPLNIEGQVYDPPAAVVVIPITGEGEPAILTRGFRGVPAEVAQEVLGDVAEAVLMFAGSRGSMRFVREDWLCSEAARAADG